MFNPNKLDIHGVGSEAYWISPSNNLPSGTLIALSSNKKFMISTGVYKGKLDAQEELNLEKKLLHT